jgi:ATP-dependent DNA helicase RecQ
LSPENNRRALARTLRDTFGIEHLRDGQADVITRVLERRDTLAIMPTGAGKSLCYQLPALHLPGLTIVVSPLIALMKDQADKLAEAGVRAVQLNSTLLAQDERDAADAIVGGDAQIVFTTPERLADAGFVALVKQRPIALFVVDEAHCISQWGHDFRPAFLEIAGALRALGDPPLLALTATATPAVVEDIGRQLGRPKLDVVNTGIYRPNLHFAVQHVTRDDEKLARLATLLREQDGAGIVYVATVRSAHEVHEALKLAGHSAALYHGRLRAQDREASQDAFMSGKARVMVATNAFGLGIDRSDLRFVVHYQMPATLEAYYQEAGRAGRDGGDASCVLLYDLRDRRVQQFFLIRRYPGADDLAAVHDALVTLHADQQPVPLATLLKAADGTADNKARVALKLLKDAGIVTQRASMRYQLARRAVDRRALDALAQDYQRKSNDDQAKLERMVFYAQSAFCRWRVLLEYFGESMPDERCGVCDNCRRPPAAQALPARAVPLRQRRAKPRPSFGPGDTVHVRKFGEGRVVTTADDQVEVVFPNGEKRTFLKRYVKRVGDSAPRALPTAA